MAFVLDGHSDAGGPEVLMIGSRPILTPRSSEVLIRVKASGLNRSELFTRQAIRLASSSRASNFDFGLSALGKDNFTR